MEDFESAESRPSERDGGATIWEELRSRREKASRRIGDGWERASENAKRYADDHAVGVAIGSLGVGLAVGILIGAVIARD